MDSETVQIENKSPLEIYQLGRELGITDFRNMAELKQKISLSLMKKEKAIIDFAFYTKDFKEKKEITIREDKLRREYFMQYIIDIESIYYEIQELKQIKMTSGIDIAEKDDPLKTKIMNEFSNLNEQFKTKKELLKENPNCALLICGDSGAGKSSFINLLVSQSILPVSIRSNTACQVRLTYDQHEKAIVIDSDNKEIHIEKINFSDVLKGYLESLDDRTKVSCKSATIYLNTPVLEGGLDIYDTIGLGESQLFNEELTKDLKDITGILFLLKKNNPIGDNTVGGLSQVINRMAKSGIPGGSMHFIINMCDQLEKSSDKENLKRNVMEQIRDKCAGLIPEITTFSAKQELFLQENHFMSKDYENIMTLIQQLHINSINTKTVSIFDFLFGFVWKTIDYIVESENFTADDKVQKKEYIKKLRNLEADRKLLNLRFRKDNDKYLKDKYELYKKDVQKYFFIDSTRTRVVTDVISGQSKLFGMTKKDDIDKEIIELTHNAILKVFKEYIEKEKVLKECCDKMLVTFLQQFAEHQKKMELINQTMNRHITNVMDNIKGDLNRMDFNDLIGLPIYQRKILQLFTPIIVPGIEIKNIVKQRFESIFSILVSKLNSSNVHKFYENTTCYVTNKSAQYYNKFVRKNSNIRVIMDCLFKAPYKVTEDFENYLTDDMNYLAKNIDLLDEDMRNKENVIRTYKNIKDRLEEFNEDLCRINLLYLQKDKHDFVYNTDITEEAIPILFNRNRVLYKGNFGQLNNSNILVFKSLDDKTYKDFYQEYLSQREILIIDYEKNNSDCIDYFLVLQFHLLWSVNNKSNLNPMFSVNEIDSTLKTQIDCYRKNILGCHLYEDKLFEEVSRLLKQIVNGLLYLHNRTPPLNHYDLTLESIGYDSSKNTIKLSSISRETIVKIDYSLQSQDEILKLVHLPVEILDANSRKPYTLKSDVYCLGSIMYYLWIGENPFSKLVKKNNIDTIENFITLIKSSKLHEIIDNSSFTCGFANMIFSWCTLCLENKITAKHLADYLLKETFYGTVNN